DRKPQVSGVVLDGMEIHVPPKGQRPGLVKRGEPGPKVHIEDVQIRDALLQLLPKDEHKSPLQFRIARLKLQSLGNETAMGYEATLTNPKPPGEIESSGRFGPWKA